MANAATTINLTTHDAAVEEIWSAEVLAAPRPTLIMEQLVRTPSPEDMTRLAAGGDTINITSVGSSDANDVVVNTDLTLQANTETNTQIVINAHKEATRVFEDSMMERVRISATFRAEYTSADAFALFTARDTALLAVHASWTNTAVGVPGDGTVDAQRLDDAIAALDAAYAPDDGQRFFVLHTSLRGPMKNLITPYQPLGQGMVLTGVAGTYMGCPVFFTPQVPTSGGIRKNVLFHRSALAIAVAKDITTKIQYLLMKHGTGVSTVTDYGVKVLRPTFGVIVQS